MERLVIELSSVQAGSGLLTIKLYPDFCPHVFKFHSPGQPLCVMCPYGTDLELVIIIFQLFSRSTRRDCFSLTVNPYLILLSRYKSQIINNRCGAFQCWLQSHIQHIKHLLLYIRGENVQLSHRILTLKLDKAPVKSECSVSSQGENKDIQVYCQKCIIFARLNPL